MTQQVLTEEEKQERILAIVIALLDDPQVVMKTEHRITLEYLIYGKVRT